MDSKVLKQVIQNEIDLYLEARRRKIQSLCVHHLGSAYILAQKSVVIHLIVHTLMLVHTCSRRDIKEIKGQLARIIATVPGHVCNKLPRGNIGWASVSMFERMDIPSDLEPCFSQKV